MYKKGYSYQRDIKTSKLFFSQPNHQISTECYKVNSLEENKLHFTDTLINDILSVKTCIFKRTRELQKKVFRYFQDVACFTTNKIQNYVSQFLKHFYLGRYKRISQLLVNVNLIVDKIPILAVSLKGRYLGGTRKLFQTLNN